MMTNHETRRLNQRAKLHGLYAITLEQTPTTAQLVTAVAQAIAGGATIIQYRNKGHDPHQRQEQALALRQLCQRHDVLLLINDDPELAQRVAADGVHLGRDDSSIAAARQRLGTGAIIGVSCYNQLDIAIQAEQAGADYVAFGSFFPSPTKPQAALAALPLLRQARQALSIPIVAIGGITIDNGARLIAAGASALAVISGVFTPPATETGADITAAARAYTRLFDHSPA